MFSRKLTRNICDSIGVNDSILWLLEHTYSHSFFYKKISEAAINGHKAKNNKNNEAYKSDDKLILAPFLLVNPCFVFLIE